MFKYDFFLKDTHWTVWRCGYNMQFRGSFLDVRYVSMLNKVWEYFLKNHGFEKKVVEIRYFRYIAC